MIGQSKLKAYFKEAIENDELRHFYIINAPQLYGKTTLVDYVGKLKKSPVVHIDNAKVQDIRGLISKCQSLSQKVIFDINNADNLNSSGQNALLKLLEEPPSRAYIFLEVSDFTKILPTVLSRATIINMDCYKDVELRQFTEDKDLLAVCESPGMVIEFLKHDYLKILKFCDAIVNNIKLITLMNVFNIANHVSFKHGEEGFPINLVLSVLQYKYRSDYVSQSIIINHKNQFRHVSVNKRNSFDIMMVKLWEAVNCENCK